MNERQKEVRLAASLVAGLFSALRTAKRLEKNNPRISEKYYADAECYIRELRRLQFPFSVAALFQHRHKGDSLMNNAPHEYQALFNKYIEIYRHNHADPRLQEIRQTLDQSKLEIRVSLLGSVISPESSIRDVEIQLLHKDDPNAPALMRHFLRMVTGTIPRELQTSPSSQWRPTAQDIKILRSLKIQVEDEQ